MVTPTPPDATDICSIVWKHDQPGMVWVECLRCHEILELPEREGRVWGRNHECEDQ